ncbi:MAG: PKD domain-containing protein [Bacteroidia bacterium]
MKTKQIILLLMAAIAVNSCKKTEYSNTSTTTQPVFYFTGSINNAPVNIQAGVNNYTMATSYAKDINNIYIYTGEFMPVGGSQSSPNSLEIFFADNSKSPASGLAHIDSVISPGYYSFSEPAGGACAYSVQFNDYFNQTASGYSWGFGDGQTANINRPTHTYAHPGVYSVKMWVYSSSCSSIDSNNIVVGQVGNAFVAPFSNGTWYTLTNGDSTNLQVSTSGVPPLTFLWSFGDGTPDKTTNPVGHTYTNPGVYSVSVTCTDGTGYTTKQYENVYTPTATGCADGFWEGTQTPISNPDNLNDVVVDWYDNTGTLWTSNNNNQHINSMFKVNSVADYKNNAAGQATKIIGATITCELYNNSNDSITFTGNVVFGVAHF